jgi:hypothetical protein
MQQEKVHCRINGTIKYTAGSITDQLVGINDPSYTVPELSGAGTHEYWVVVTGGCGSKNK